MFAKIQTFGQDLFFGILWEEILDKMLPKISISGQITDFDQMFGKHLFIRQPFKMFAKSGEINSQTSVNHTNHCAINTVRSKLLEGSGQPCSHGVNILAAVMWRKLVRCAIDKIGRMVWKPRRKKYICVSERRKSPVLGGDVATILPSSRPLDHVFTFSLVGCHLHSLLSFGWAWVGSGLTQLAGKRVAVYRSRHHLRKWQLRN